MSVIKLTNWWIVLLLSLVITTTTVAYLNQHEPFAAIEYQTDEAQSINGTAEGFSRTSPTYFRDTVSGETQYWLLDPTPVDNTMEVSTIRGYAHLGQSGLSQSQANDRIDTYQLWRWYDGDGDGAADLDDARYGSTTWEKVAEYDPNNDEAGVPQKDVEAYSITATLPPPDPTTADWNSTNLLASGDSLTLKRGRSYLFVIRVIGSSGNTNLMQSVGGAEQWDDGKPNQVGSDVPSDKYIDMDGNTPGTTDGRLQDDDVVRVYIMKSPQ